MSTRDTVWILNPGRLSLSTSQNWDCILILIHKIADLLVDASTRTQLVVTTHSEILVDALHDRPEAIVVCEKHDGQTTMERLDASKLAIWLEKYRLGDLWTSGQLGGVRW